LAWTIIEAQYQANDAVKFDAVVCSDSETEWNHAWSSWETALDGKSTVQATLASFQQRIIRSCHDGGRYRHHESASPSGQTLLVIYDHLNATNGNRIEEVVHSPLAGLVSKYTMTVCCGLAESSCWIGVVRQDKPVITDGQAHRMTRQFSYILNQIRERPHAQISDLLAPNPEDIAEILSWNREAPKAVESCAHTIIQRWATERPNAIAVSSSEGELTYSEVVNLAVRLAHHLVDQGIKQETFVPLCFSKSLWTTVAMLGVAMAGGAFVLLESSYPPSRLASICDHLEAPLIICSGDNEELSHKLASVVVVIDKAHTEFLWNQRAHSRELPQVQPSNALYIVFTSGSSGIPKGVVIEHRSFCSSALAHNPPFRLGPSSRMIQSHSYAFDMSIMETLSTLVAGGCVCVLSEAERMNNYVEAARAQQPTHACLTPSFARSIPRHSLNQIGLQVIIFGGERVDPSDQACIDDRIQVMNGYGPAECSLVASVQVNFRRALSASNIGHPTGAAFWAVNPHDPQILAPVGGVGELLIEGPLVGRGYLKETMKTRAAFIDPPGWLLGARTGPPCRVYRTGDLVRWQADGSWSYVGRMDNQVKIRGQRVELGDIESHARLWFKDAMDLVAEVISFPVRPTVSRSSIAVFVLHPAANGQRLDDTPFAQPTDTFLAASQLAKGKLRKSLPRHMVPSLFVSLVEMPRTTSGKTDRRALREHLERQISSGGMQPYTQVPEAENSLPLTDTQKALQAIWAQVLNLPLASIGIHDSFFDLGGDSLHAMQVAAAARSSGIQLMANDIFTNPVLLALSSVSSPEMHTAVDMTPFSLIDLPDASRYIVGLRERGMLPEQGQVTDILPATPFQQEMIDTCCLNRYFFSYRGTIAVDRLRAACEAVWARHCILRTVFVPYKTSLAQVIMSGLDVPFRHSLVDADPLQRESSLRDIPRSTLIGQTQTQFALLSHSQMQQHTFSISLCHAQCDAVSSSQLIQDIARAYRGDSLTGQVDFRDYIYWQNRYQIDQAHAFWQEYLDGSSITRVPDLSHLPNHNHERRPISLTRPPGQDVLKTPAIPNGITLATLVKAAWAFTLSEFAHECDIVFGQFVSGRNAPLPNIDGIVGPCVKELPLRVTIQNGWTVQEFLAHVHAQHIRTLQFDYLDLADIVDHCTPWRAGTRPSSRILHLSEDLTFDLPFEGAIPQSSWTDEVFKGTSDVWVHSHPQGDKLKLFLSTAHEGVLQVGAPLLERLCDLVEILPQELEKPLSTLRQRF
jgi:amino acid adenylation domain-containing protein